MQARISSRLDDYSRYEKRGFEQGSELQDWLDAEREIRQMTNVEREAETF